MCLFANSIDNAIEANVNVPKSKRSIKLSAAVDKGFFVMKLINATVDTLDIKDSNIETTKADKEMHGFGLASIREIARRYSGTLSIEGASQEFRLYFIAPMVQV